MSRDVTRDADRDLPRATPPNAPRGTAPDAPRSPAPDAPPGAAAPPGPPPPAPEFARWYAAYPRQQGEVPARQAWAAARPLMPSLGELLAKLELQKASPEWQNPRFVPLPARYLHEHRWRDQPAPDKPTYRSPAAELRAMGSDEGRREALRRISEASRFDPFDDFPGEKGPRA